MLAALVYAINELDLDAIDQKFLETGHTLMECDSMHRFIEQLRKKIGAEIYVPSDWLNIIRAARTRKPFVIREFIRIEKANPNVVLYRCRTDFESVFSRYEVPGRRRDSRRTARGIADLPRAYQAQTLWYWND